MYENTLELTVLGIVGACENIVFLKILIFLLCWKSKIEYQINTDTIDESLKFQFLVYYRYW